MRRLDICINTKQIIYKALELDSTLKNKSYNALLCWCYDFLKRNFLSIWKTTHVGQKLKANSFEEYQKFFKILYSKKRNNKRK